MKSVWLKQIFVIGEVCYNFYSIENKLDSDFCKTNDTN